MRYVAIAPVPMTANRSSRCTAYSFRPSALSRGLELAFADGVRDQADRRLELVEADVVADIRAEAVRARGHDDLVLLEQVGREVRPRHVRDAKRRLRTVERRIGRRQRLDADRLEVA